MPANIRGATIEDAAHIARVHVASWRETYAGIVPEGVLASLSVDERAAAWLERIVEGKFVILVAEAAGAVCGFASGGPAREGLSGFEGEIYALYVLHSAQKQGTGAALIRRVGAELSRQGFSSAGVWVLAANPARGFYEHLGGRFVVEKPVTIGDAALPEIALGWPDLRTLVGDPAAAG